MSYSSADIESFSVKVKEFINKEDNRDYYIVISDINGFKVFNAIYGRNKGDEFLEYVADVYGNVISQEDGVWEYLGADDFILCTYAQSFEKFRRLSSEIYKGIKEFPVAYEFLTSVGIYKIEDFSMPVASMYDRAVIALNEAKSNASYYEIYDNKMQAKLISNQEILNEFSAALKNNELKVYFQPQYNILNGKIVGAEALVRWIHPTKGYIPPSDFVPVLENNGLVGQLDKYIADEVCRLMKYFADTCDVLPPAIAINIARGDLFSSDFIYELNSIVRKYGVPNIVIRLEITESVYVSRPDYLVKLINKLRELGYKVEMDDFGSGYSSLNALKDLEIDLLKLDMKFISSSNTDKGRKIVKAVVAMADDIGVPVLVEGVETGEQVDFLKSVGCKYVQGYYYGRPMTMEEYIELVLNNEYEYIVNEG